MNEKLIVTYPEFLWYTKYLTERIRNHPTKFDCIIGITRGGLIPATYISHQLDIPMFTLDISTKKSYKNNAVAYEHMIELITYDQIQVLPLIIDEINDSGDTFSMLNTFNSGRYDFKYAALYERIGTKFKADIVGAEVHHDLWVEFPWESKI